LDSEAPSAPVEPESVPRSGRDVPSPGHALLLCDHRGEGSDRLVDPLTRAGLEIATSSNLRQTLERLGRQRPELILLDPLAAGTVELEALDAIRGQAGPIPLLVIADARDPLPALSGARGLSGGPWDVVSRGAPPEEFLLRIERLQHQARGLAELDDLRHQATHDDRTDLLRPHTFQERLREHFQAAQRHGFDLALLLLDLDRFGLVNKQYDHTIGDYVIGQVGRVIRATLRAEDVAGRLGGDEFAVLLPYTRKLDATRVVERLLVEIRGLTGPMLDTHTEVPVSTSIGYETYSGRERDLDGVARLRSHAEISLRHAKTGGGDASVYYRSLPEFRSGTGPGESPA
jgi:diguanylate cyclase (GGDEF)-like protein